MEKLGMENVGRYEHELLVYATRGLKTIPGLRLIGTAADKASVLSFVLEGFSTEEVGSALNKEGIAVRSGHHCAQRSEEHTSELQSLMRISYAVFCLKKK